MLTALLIVVAALLVVGAGEIVRGLCSQMLSNPSPRSLPAVDQR